MHRKHRYRRSGIDPRRCEELRICRGRHNPADYDAPLGEMTANDGAVGSPMRRDLARKAYALTASYDAAIASWMAREKASIS